MKLSKHFSCFIPFLEKELESKDLNSFIYNVYFIEKRIMERDFRYFGTHIRDITDILKPLLVNYAKKHNISYASRNKRTGKRTYSFTNIKKYAQQKEIQDYIDLVVFGNQSSHYNDDKIKSIYDLPRISVKGIKFYLNIASKLVKFLNWKFDTNVVFADFLYKDGSLTWNAIPYAKELWNMKDEKCSFCDGVYKEPGFSGFQYPYGPVLECDICSSILSLELKLKRRKNGICQHTDCNSKIKEIIDLKNNKQFISCDENRHEFDLEGYKEKQYESLQEIIDNSVQLHEFEEESENFYEYQNDVVWDENEDPMSVLEDLENIY